LLVAEIADVFSDEKITLAVGEPMQRHMKQDNSTYKPTRVSQVRKVPLRFQSEASLKRFDTADASKPFSTRLEPIMVHPSIADTSRLAGQP
jgi:hypothetical protein